MQYKPFQIRKHHSAYDTALISYRINTAEAESVISIVIPPVRRIMATGSFMGTSAKSLEMEYHTLPVIKRFFINMILHAPFFFDKTTGAAILNDLRPFFHQDFMCRLFQEKILLRYDEMIIS